MDNFELDNKLIEDKSIVDKKIKKWCAGIMLGYLLIMAYFFWCEYLKYGMKEDLWQNILMGIKMPEDMLSISLTLGMIFLSVFPIFSEMTSVRIVNISYKAIFFKTTVYKFCNYPTSSAMIVTAMLISGISEYLELGVISNLFQTIALLVIMICSFIQIYMLMVGTIKKSRIYRKIASILKGDREKYQLSKTACLIIEKLNREMNRKSLDTSANLKHNSYIYEEIGVFIYLALILKKESNNEITCQSGEQLSGDDKIYIYNSIIEYISKLIKNDTRNNDVLLSNIQQKGKKEFVGCYTEFNNIFSNICDRFPGNP